MFSIKHHFRQKTCITDNTFPVKACIADNNNACRIFHKTYGDAAGILNISTLLLLQRSAQRFHLFRCQRNLLTQTTCTVGGNQIIFFIADATKMTIFF